ncbi:SGNH/GDSL hydrolase family protein [Massilibacterium senegalense]|uniref:SGNH/GDSL hydrolase family protein n=1 Tax=Massilibacterium senegalense TaxID=1632858 RepID=UPI00078360F8|nr:SGNH/GDSL hydrolase family protein [Massilibacterium senegalense]
MKLIFKMGIAVILALICWQVILMNTVNDSTGYKGHPDLGRIYKEGTYVHATEGYSRTHINSLGMREEEITEKEKNEFRILTLGDSFTEAFQVHDKYMYSTQLESNLKKVNNFNVKTINAGRSGACPAHYIHLADFYQNTLHQDYTVIQLNDGDFVEDMLDQTRNFYVEKDGKTFKSVHNQDFQSANPLVQKFPQLKYLSGYTVFRLGADKAQKIAASSSSSDSSDETTNEKPTTFNSKDIEVINYDSLVEWTIEELKKKYPNVVVLYIPQINYYDLETPPSEIETLLEKHAANYDVDFINMREDFISYYEEYKTPAHGFHNTTPGTGHTNKIGHQLIATKLSNFFESRLVD